MNHWSKQLKEKLDTRSARVSIVGMGYVGLSLAVELAKAGLTVRGIDLDLERVNLLNRGESYLVDVAADTLAPLVAAGTLSATTSSEDAESAEEKKSFRSCSVCKIKHTKRASWVHRGIGIAQAVAS